MPHDGRTNRRDVLKKIGITGAATLGATGTVVASRSADSSAVDELLASEEVQAIADSVSNLQFQSQRAEVTEMGSEADDARLSVTSVPANFGELQVIESSESDTRKALFEFDQHRPNLDYEWPRGTDAQMVAIDADVTFVRTATEDETASVAAALGTDDIEVSTNSKIDGYHALDVDTSAQRVESIRLAESSGPSARAAGSELRVVDREVYEPNTDAVSIQSCDCGEILANVVLCVSQISACSTCYSLASIPGFGAPAVAACVIATGCISLADLWTGCTALAGDYSCFTDCVYDAYDEIGNPL